MTTHYVPKPTLREAAINKQKIIVAACGQVSPTDVAYTPRLVTCSACRRSMISEEREA